MMYWRGYGWSFFGVLVMYLWWALVALAVLWLVRHTTRRTEYHTFQGSGDESALDIMNK